MSDYIQISKTVARWILNNGRELVSDGLGRAWTPLGLEPLEHDGTAFLDTLDEESDTYKFVSALIFFVKAMAGIAAAKLLEDAENDIPEILDLSNEI